MFRLCFLECSAFFYTKAAPLDGSGDFFSNRNYLIDVISIREYFWRCPISLWTRFFDL